jgi:hypothetical protein
MKYVCYSNGENDPYVFSGTKRRTLQTKIFLYNTNNDYFIGSKDFVIHEVAMFSL